MQYFSNALSKLFGVSDCGMRSLHPNQITIRSILDSTSDAVLKGHGLFQSKLIGFEIRLELP